MQKTAIAIYDPKDPWERAVQDTAKEYLGTWLPSFACQAVARGIASLKSFSDWMEKPELYKHRIRYFFAPKFTENKSHVVFVTHLLFLRDMLENREINALLHDPVVFVTRPIAHYLLREYPIHITLDYERLKADNKDTKSIEVGGMLIYQDVNVKLSPESVLDVRSQQNDRFQYPVDQSDVDRVRYQTGIKAAARAISRGVFKIDEHNRALLPDMKVYDKEKRAEGHIFLVEPGDTGLVGITYLDGTQVTVSKLFFDTRYAVV